MASRETQRTEANVQSDLHALLLAAPLDLDENDLQDLDVVLEQQAGSRKRIDVEAGFCVFEVKKDLRKGSVRSDAVVQLGGYVQQRSQAMKQRYVGVLTDGAEWHLYHLDGEGLRAVSSVEIDPTKPGLDKLLVWLEGVLATAEKIKPTPREIERKLGALSPGHALDYAELSGLYAQHRELPTVKLKRELWARLLTTALGTGFVDSDALFVEHTLLVVSAELIAHAVMGLDPNDAEVAAASILSGQLFANAQVNGVVEADFFDWVVEVPGGDPFVKALAKRLSRFDWQDVEHDVLKVLYESVITTAQRKKLGEYYTPDWLAERAVDAAVTDALAQRVLDPSCGSGTFLFHAIRRYLDAAKARRWSNSKALQGLTQRVVGMDIHPVAVTFARVTYLLAIGPDRLQADDRPPLSIPVYLGDSIQWGQERTLFNNNALVIPTIGAKLFATDLRFPERTLTEAGRFDEMVSELATLAADRTPGTPPPSLAALFRRFAIHAADQPALRETFETLCKLHDNGRDHIWGYYVRNLARPYWMTRPANQVDVLVGNPPWLSYRYMTSEMQREFQRLSQERGLWAGAAVATNQDLSALFILRVVERYLRVGGRFGFVMPWSALRGQQFAGLRKGRYELAHDKKFSVAFGEAWDLHAVKPPFFPVPACVLFGERTSGKPAALSSKVEAWKGDLPRVNVTWQVAEEHIERMAAVVQDARSLAPAEMSPYDARFAQGATVVPRMLFVVEKKTSGPLGSGAGRVTVRSLRSANEKEPWKSLPALEGNVERQFVMPLHTGQTMLPYRMLDPLRAVIPWEARTKRLLSGEDENLPLYAGLKDWWKKAEKLWDTHRSAKALPLREQLDYRGKLVDQFPLMSPRVVYNASGMYLAAAIITDPAVIEHALYWATASSMEEARYLVAVLNSDVLTQRIRPLQARGEHNPRHYDTYVWQVPVPMFDPNDPVHERLAELAEKAEEVATAVSLPKDKRFETLRGLVRRAVQTSEAGQEIEKKVTILLNASTPKPSGKRPKKRA
jgi:hypothetical protein